MAHTHTHTRTRAHAHAHTHTHTHTHTKITPDATEQEHLVVLSLAIQDYYTIYQEVICFNNLWFKKFKALRYVRVFYKRWEVVRFFFIYSQPT